ncbi:MAG: DoxX family protein [Bacteroidales bacterium]|nr:DoxX family protein [Bacteroidales bacterium]
MSVNRAINWLSWLFLVVNLLSAYLISIVEDYQLWFVLLLSINIVVAIGFAKRINKTVLIISRVLVGLLFIYSGFVKGVDPLGTQFRIEDYFYAYGTVWAIPFALALSIFLNVFEFSIGALILTKIKAQWINTLAFLMMVFFTITTLNDALYNPVPDCGCFGDALIITNWQTLYKNLVIDAFVMLLVIRRIDIKLLWPSSAQLATLVIIVFGFVGFEFYNIKNLPLVDFRPWKVGNRLLPENPKPIEYFLTYQNTKTGDTKEYLSKELPWQDSVFKADWKWLSSREEDPNVDEKRTFPMVDEEGNDWSNDLVSNENGLLIVSIYDVSKLSIEDSKKLNQLFAHANEESLEIVMLNSNSTDVYNKYKQELLLPVMDMYSSDDTALKAAVRSNPGLIIVKDAKVLAKYHICNFPNKDEINNILK